MIPTEAAISSALDEIELEHKSEPLSCSENSVTCHEHTYAYARRALPTTTGKRTGRIMESTAHT
jgi:hypothetical protein